MANPDLKKELIAQLKLICKYVPGSSADKNRGIEVLAEILEKAHSPLAYLNNKEHHKNLRTAMFVLVTKGSQADLSLIKLLLMPKEALDRDPKKKLQLQQGMAILLPELVKSISNGLQNQDPKKQQEMKEWLVELLTTLEEKGAIKLDKKPQEVADNIVKLEKKEQEQVMELLLTLTMISLYGFNTKGEFRIPPAAVALATNSAGITLGNIVTADDNSVLKTTTENSQDAKSEVNTPTEIKNAALKAQQDTTIAQQDTTTYKTPTPADKLRKHTPPGVT